jgi:hypothetical protein
LTTQKNKPKGCHEMKTDDLGKELGIPKEQLGIFNIVSQAMRSAVSKACEQNRHLLSRTPSLRDPFYNVADAMTVKLSEDSVGKIFNKALPLMPANINKVAEIKGVSAAADNMFNNFTPDQKRAVYDACVRKVEEPSHLNLY